MPQSGWIKLILAENIITLQTILFKTDEYLYLIIDLLKKWNEFWEILGKSASSLLKVINRKVIISAYKKMHYFIKLRNIVQFILVFYPLKSPNYGVFLF